MIFILFVIIASNAALFGQAKYNHPELDWYTFETKNFKIHYHDGTEVSAREAATVAEMIFPKITEFYDFIPETMRKNNTFYIQNMFKESEYF